MRLTNNIFLQLCLLIIVLFLSIFLNTYKLESVPSGFYVDEAVTGYNAYSLLQTGKDEYGVAWPIALRYFGSYSPPLYAFITSAIIEINGYSINSIRLLSSISASLMVLVAFFFLKSLKLTGNWVSPILGVLLFAVCPWNIIFARAGYEIYLGFFIFSLGALFLWMGINKGIFIPIGISLLSLSMYGAHTERFLVPIFLTSIFILFRKKMCMPYFILGILLALLIQIPNMTIATTPAFATKNDLFYSSVLTTQSVKIPLLPNPVSLLLSFTREFSSQYLTYFSPRSLFSLPDPDPQRSIPDLSVFYPWMVIPYFAGLFTIWQKRRSDNFKFIAVLSLTAPLPMALTGDPFSTQRALPLLLPLVLIMSAAADLIIQKLPCKIWITASFILLTVSGVMLWRSYFVLLPNERAKAWGYGFEQLAEEIKKHSNEKFIIDQSRTKPAYIELAFFLKYPPEKFHQEVDRSIRENYYTNARFDSYYNFGNIETRNIKWEEDVYNNLVLVGDSLAISKNQEKEHSLTQIFEIKDPLGQVVFQGFRTNPIEKCKASSFQSPLCMIKE